MYLITFFFFLEHVWIQERFILNHLAFCWLHYAVSMFYSVCLLGFVELDLHKTIIPAKVPEKCNIEMIPEYKADSSQKASMTASLFEQKSMKGWWPCCVEKDGSRILAVWLLLPFSSKLQSFNCKGSTWEKILINRCYV